MASDMKIFKVFAIFASVKFVIPRAGQMFIQDEFLQRSIRFSYMPNLVAKGPMAYDKKTFKVFSTDAYVQLPVLKGQFQPRGYNMKKLGEGLFDDTTCQIGILRPFGLGQDDI